MAGFAFRPYREQTRVAEPMPLGSGDAFRLELVVALGFVLGWSLLRFGVAAARGLDFEGSLAGVVCAATAALVARSSAC
jgi:hypothetical protein